MAEQLKNLEFYIWNKENNDWNKSKQNIKKGIYLIQFHPEKTIYEIRDLSKHPAKKHTINNNEIVLKPGKFNGGINSRFFGSSGYAKYWQYDDGILYNKRNLSNCFEESATVYLLADLSSCQENDFIELVEVYTKLELKRLAVEKQELLISEYLRYTNKFEELKVEIIVLRQKIEGFVKDLMHKYSIK